MTVTVTTLPGSDLSTGWTGIAHHQPTVEGSQTTANLDCVGDACQVSSTSLTGTPFGPPLPLASGGVPACVLNKFAAEVTGTYDCATGSGETSVHLASTVIQTSNVERPCPRCVGDATLNDGVKGGTCDSGASQGQPCDAGGHSPTFGDTSNDCLPSATGLDVLQIDIAPLTTGTITQTANLECGDSADFGNNCFCPGDAGPDTNQNRPNSCTDPGHPSGVCGPSDICPVLPSTSTCSEEKILTCSTDDDCVACLTPFPGCSALFPSAGTCQAGPTPCFGGTITRTGTPGTTDGVLVGFFCVPQTKHAPAISSVAGLPGPGVVILPVHAERHPR